MSTTPESSPADRSASDHPTSTRHLVQTVALIYGIIFLLVGVAGFIPGLTSNYETMQFAGHQSEAMLMGVFQVSILHNIVHLLYGIAGVALSRRADNAQHYLLWGGIVYLVLWLYGLFVGHESPANFVPLNTADNWLHLALGVTMVALSFLRREPRRAQPRGAAYTR
jgi:arginine exporter protein ArgO